MNLTIFDRLCDARVETVPFPHVVIENTLDDALLMELIEKRPQIIDFIDSRQWIEGEKLHIPSRRSLKELAIPEVWKDTVNHHLLPEKAHLWLETFAPFIRKQYPDLENRLGALDMWRIGCRGLDSPDSYEGLIDAQISMHAPCPQSNIQERGPHLKIANKLLVAHCMLRLPEDNYDGGDLELYETEPGARLIFGPQQQVVNKQRIKLAKTIAYQRGVSLLFLNSPAAVQTMSPRAFCPYPTFYINVVLEVSEPLFAVPSFAGH